ncbi:hypothetical protein M8C21_021662 [Ambrosia artemisiifolia]|uniref:Uncharacterized protein n=1 Tax=Ambrosia artemisiifolia TaxID=4212 RepID=A0AAD5GPG2_AMBAR|nr:hypothetical protein M8C21_021662 [Ambrosia artemisiifolia]
MNVIQEDGNITSDIYISLAETVEGEVLIELGNDTSNKLTGSSSYALSIIQFLSDLHNYILTGTIPGFLGTMPNL